MLTLAHRAMLGAASRPKPPVQIITLAGSGTSTDNANAVAVGADGSRVVVGYTGSPISAFVVKFDKDGMVLWQRRLSLASRCLATSVVIDAAGGVYIVGDGRVSGSIDTAYIAKFNASGALQWQRKLSTSFTVRAVACAIGGGGDLYCLLDAWGAKTFAVIVKYSSGGALQWQKAISHATNSLSVGSAASAMFVGTSDDIYLCGAHHITNPGDTWGLVVKCNSSGGVQAAFANRIESRSNVVAAVAVDSSGDIYTAGASSSIGVTKPCISRLNSSGAVQWCRWVSGDSALTRIVSVSVSADGLNVYAWGTTHLFNFLTADGSLVWQREISGPAAAGGGLYRMGAEPGFLHISSTLYGMPGTGTDALVAKLPDDGSGLGTYGSAITYSESALTSNVGSPSTATPTITDAAGSLTEAAGDMTDAAGTLTVTPYL